MQDAYKTAHQEKKKKMFSTILQLKDRYATTSFKIPLKKTNENSQTTPETQMETTISTPDQTKSNTTSKLKDTVVEKKSFQLPTSTPKLALKSTTVIPTNVDKSRNSLKHITPINAIGSNLKQIPTNNTHVKNSKQISPNNVPEASANKANLVPKFKDVIQEQKLFHDSLNSPNPCDNLTFLLSSYVKKISPLSSSDSDLLQNNLSTNDKNDPLSPSHLSLEEKAELYGLMSRSVGIINFYQLFGIEYDLREYKLNRKCVINESDKNNNNLVRGMPLKFDSRQEESDYWWNSMLNLTIAELFIVYRHLQARFSSPFRKITMFYGVWSIICFIDAFLRNLTFCLFKIIIYAPII